MEAARLQAHSIRARAQAVNRASVGAPVLVQSKPAGLPKKSACFDRVSRLVAPIAIWRRRTLGWDEAVANVEGLARARIRTGSSGSAAINELITRTTFVFALLR
jgi:hypothetical protein